MTSEKPKRKNWTREETLGFLRCYSARKDEFLHSRKKKYAYDHVLEDMISQGIAESSMTTGMLEGKMRTLLSAYKASKDNERQTGASPCPPPFMEEMEEIFGERPEISNVRTIEFGFGPVQTPHQPPHTSTTQVAADEPLGKKRKSYKEEYYKAKMARKEKKDSEKVEILKELNKNFKEYFNKRIDQEERKIELIKEYLYKMK